MPTHDDFVADVAAVYKGDKAKGSFGTGRLIAPNLVLTAGHVVDYPTRGAPTRAGWKVALIAERNQDGSWTASAHDAEVVWRGSGIRPSSWRLSSNVASASREEKNPTSMALPGGAA